ncbi:ATP-binding protein [Stenotrophomonas sp. CFBP 13725]|uniref:sensor histidine kinase n=1 Tax=Stenotrophomonas sp. CFBP 13725 TaxID=2775297 RepID=UPI0017848AFC|nr:ATP-binding protein [Stenotrophomonas sp. CFBP 13725]MBD8634930.1 response regulator [Stenotrophomonas sp. CFBP 13725]
MRLRRTLALLLSAWLALLPASAQPVPPTPRQLTVFDGLPSNTVNRMAEDRLGYLWIATNDGLARFDGRSYRIWRAEDGLRDNRIWTVLADARNQLWIGTENAGLVRLSADRRVMRFYDRDSQPLLASNTVWSVAATPDGAIWFGTYEGGLYRIDADDTLQRFLPEEGNDRSLPSNSVPFLATLPDGSLWVGTKRGLARWTGHDFERAPDSVLGDAMINGMTADADGSLWINTLGSVIVRHADGRFEPAPWPVPAGDQVLGMMLHDEQGGYWLDTRSGLGRGVAGRFQQVPLYSALARGRVRPNWSGAFQDREGGIWLASLNAGLWHLLPRWWQFSVLSRLEDDPASLRNAFVLGTAAAADGGVWTVGGHGALDKLDPATGKVEQHLTWVNGNHWLMSVAEDDQGNVWTGSMDALARYEPGSRRVRRWGRDDGADAVMEGNVQDIAVCGGLVWTMSPTGVQARDLQGRVQVGVPLGEGGLRAGQLNISLECGPRGQPWLAGSQGLQEWDPHLHVFALVDGGPAGAVHAMAFASGDQVWLSQDGRLVQHRWTGSALQRHRVIGAVQGYPALAANGLAVDETGIVWASSPRGMLRVDPRVPSVRLYGVHDGLPSQEFRENTLVASRSGQLLAGTPAGVVLFDPLKVGPPTRQAPLVIERVEVSRGDRTVELTHATPMVIEDGDRDLHIVARLLSFSDAASNVYRYRLGGYDPDWVDAGAGGERVFSRLPPGHYALEVQARSADHVWSKVQTLEFDVLPPWWRSVTGVLMLMALGLLLLSGFAWLYRRRLQRRHAYQMAVHKQEVAEQASAAKTRFLANLGHEVRTPMTGVLGMTELLLSSPLDTRQRNHAESIRSAGEHLLLLVNDALDLARIESGRLELQSQLFDLNLLLADVQALTAPLARQKGVQFRLQNELTVGLCAQGDPLRVRQILLNLLGNAVKFTQRGSITLRARSDTDAQGLHFDVSDTGPGISSELQKRLFRRYEQADGARTAAQYGGSGLGLAISRELAVAMGGDIAVRSQLGNGTCFSVVLPLPLQDGSGHADGEGPHAVAVPAAPLRILLVEDDPTVAEVIAGLLAARGHQVVHAEHALAALREMAGDRFDIGLLDLDLPGLSGFDLALHLRNQAHDLPLLAVTARTDPDLAEQVAAADMQGFLRKPVTGELLAEAIARALTAR